MLILGQSTGSAITDHKHAVTPLIASQWERLLQGYDGAPYLTQGIKQGFRLGVNEDTNTWSAKPSNPDSTVMAKLSEEVEKSRILGPFHKRPIKNLHTSPISAIEKKRKGTFRLIHNLSAPRGGSVNDAIPEHLKSVNYCYVQDVVQYLLSSKRKNQYMSKVDIKEAFRIIPVHPSDWKWLGIQLQDAYYVDTTLPMGCSTSCAIFQSITRGLCWMARQNMQDIVIFGYLDDFLIISPDLNSAVQHLQGFQDLCSTLGVPLASEKTVGPTMQITFLGIGIDTFNSTLFLDEEKRQGAIEKLEEFVTKRSQRRIQWQSLVGTLSFLSQIVIPGRAFMSRISASLKSTNYWIHVDESTKEDIRSWITFIRSHMFKPFRMFDITIPPTLHIFTDASGSLGFGALMGSSWCFGAWDDEWWLNQNIMLLELYPIWLAIQIWGYQMRNTCVMFHTDNQALIPAIQNRKSKLRPINRILRDISLASMQFNFLIMVKHIPGVDNYMADHLSRLQVSAFRERAGPTMDEEPTAIPTNLLPLNYKDTLARF